MKQVPPFLNLIWNKCQGNLWCPLNTVNLAHSHFDGMSGVYIIWHGGTNPRTVYVGKGNIRDRLAAHRTEQAIQSYDQYTLFVTWASVPDAYQGGAERELANRLNPVVGSRYSDDPPIGVNLPW